MWLNILQFYRININKWLSFFGILIVLFCFRWGLFFNQYSSGKYLQKIIYYYVMYLIIINMVPNIIFCMKSVKASNQVYYINFLHHMPTFVSFNEIFEVKAKIIRPNHVWIVIKILVSYTYFILELTFLFFVYSQVQIGNWIAYLTYLIL